MASLLTTSGKIDRRAVMRRAWALMVETYRFGAMSFLDIGRKCFASCLRRAWAEARDQIAVRAIPTHVRSARIEELQEELGLLVYLDDWRYVNRRSSEIHVQIKRLAA